MSQDNVTYTAQSGKNAQMLLRQMADRDDIEFVMIYAQDKEGELAISYSEATVPFIYWIASLGKKLVFEHLRKMQEGAAKPPTPSPPSPRGLV